MRIIAGWMTKSSGIALSTFLVLTLVSGMLMPVGSAQGGELIPLTSSASTIDLSDSETTSGDGWTYADGAFTIIDGANVTVQGATTSNRLVVESGATATVILDNVSIDVSGTANACAFDMAGATVEITLQNANSLKSGTGAAAIRVLVGSALTIDGTGTLEALGGGGGAGIGGNGVPMGGSGSDSAESCGSVTINGGTVTATGGSMAAGIGGGGFGNYTAYHMPGGAGGVVIINGGTVVATGGASGAGIGGGGSDTNGAGSGGAGGDVTITGGHVTAVAGVSSRDSAQGAGIGGGSSWNSDGGAGSALSITGGVVVADGGEYGPGIGRGRGGTGNPSGSGSIDGDAIVISSTSISGLSKTNGIIIEDTVGTVVGSVTMPGDLNIPANTTLTVGEDATLTIPDDVTLTVEGALENDGTILNNGTIDGTGATLPEFFTVAFGVSFSGAASDAGIVATYDGKTIQSGVSVTGGKTLVLTATGSGAVSETYSYVWDDAGASSGASLTISSLSDSVNLTCAVEGIQETGTTAIEGGNQTFVRGVELTLVASGNGGDVSWSTENTSYATINPSTGELTWVSSGAVVVTASRAANTQYTASTATVTLTCIDMNTLNDIITEAKAVESGGKYTTPAWEEFTAALADAEALLSQSDIAQEQIDEAVSGLSEAKEALKITDGTFGFHLGIDSYTRESSSDLILIAARDLSLHTGVVEVDGALLVEGVHYVSESGSTRITLFSSYLNTLSTGVHTLAIEYASEIEPISDEFTVLMPQDTGSNEKPDVTGNGSGNTSDLPRAGDVSTPYLLFMLVLSLIGAAMLLPIARRLHKQA